ncbi:class I SAM-dependent methyltransferase [Candidatus Bathyarchaeota archaeon]|nr:class I SAM-dependent methyltransferase [Candidatus Bathyarchaeota archaeon]
MREHFVKRTVISSRIRSLLPNSIRRISRTWVLGIRTWAEYIDRVSLRGELIPPLRIRAYSGIPTLDEYFKGGHEFLDILINLCQLKSNEKVLDVGCGCGQMAIFLTKYLSNVGLYEGFDINKAAIGWCNKEISSRHRNFTFSYADVYNKYYNPGGYLKPSEFKFPFQSQSFDLVLLKSVFTHMLPADVENYLSEVSHVLKKGGRSLITFFLLNDESLEHIKRGVSSLNFRYDMGVYRTISPYEPEAAVAYDERFIRGLYDDCKLEIMEPIQFGSWCGRSRFLSYQDIVVASRL